jgi:hypothetical protein
MSGHSDHCSYRTNLLSFRLGGMPPNLKLEDIMKSVLVLAALLASGSAHAYSSLKHSCVEVHVAVLNNGAMIIHTGHGTYDRYVSGSSYCPAGLFARNAWVPTADNNACFVGYTCESGGDGGL